MDYFLLDPNSGELRIARPLDKESIDNNEGILKFTVKVSSNHSDINRILIFELYSSFTGS